MNEVTSSSKPADPSLRLPDFIIGGAPRSGTTWLYRLLERHPNVYLAKPINPEPKFFLVDDLFRKGLHHYSVSWFADAPDISIAGEKSTNYLESRIAAHRIRRHLPQARLVFILREPAARAYSNYLWSRMHGFEDEPFEIALELEDQREQSCPPPLRFARPHAYFSRGLYAECLAAYFELFPREHILCLKYEDITAAPGLLTEKLHAFLGVRPRPHDWRGVGVINPSAGSTAEESVLASLRERYKDANRKLVDLLGPGFSWSS